jgi:CheY-like chemotaxis protein
VKVLAVDDDPRTLELLTSVLEPQGFRLLKACGGREGIAIAETEHPDLIILELLMPNMIGFEVIDRLDKSPATTRLPIIIFTVKQLSAEEKGRLKGRIVGLVRKADFNPKGFVEMVRNALQRNLRGVT